MNKMRETGRMTSTEINVGLTEGTRNSSRVLRPPGGGHTDIFGGVTGQAQPPRRDHGRNVSSILEGTNPQGPASQLSPTESGPPAQSSPTEAGPPAQSSPTEPAPPPQPIPQARADPTPQPIPQARVDPTPQQSRARVPPGGFSSGLW